MSSELFWLLSSWFSALSVVQQVGLVDHGGHQCDGVFGYPCVNRELPLFSMQSAADCIENKGSSLFTAAPWTNTNMYQEDPEDLTRPSKSNSTWKLSHSK